MWFGSAGSGPHSCGVHWAVQSMICHWHFAGDAEFGGVGTHWPVNPPTLPSWQV
jgi:hypothetical protein